MKVLLYTESLKAISKSGLGKAIKHQMKALDSAKISYTNDPNEQPYDVAHINFYLLKSYRLAKKLRKQDVPVVYHAHSTEEDFRNSFIGSNLVSPLFKKWLCKCYRLGDIIITPTEYSKKLLKSYHLNRKIYAISNGIELEFFKRDEKGHEGNGCVRITKLSSFFQITCYSLYQKYTVKVFLFTLFYLS